MQIAPSNTKDLQIAQEILEAHQVPKKCLLTTQCLYAAWTSVVSDDRHLESINCSQICSIQKITEDLKGLLPFSKISWTPGDKSTLFAEQVDLKINTSLYCWKNRAWGQRTRSQSTILESLQIVSMGLKPTIDNAICMTTLDGLLIFELTLRGQLDPIRRRPHDRERAELVQSGNVFLFNDVDSGIKRWTDGITWSPSRIMGNYLIYRELAQPFPPGEKKKAQKRVSKSRRGNTNDSQSPQLGEGSIGSGTPVSAGDTDRNLVGSLVDSYGFKSNGLVKKTLSIKMEDGRLFHLISYYRPDDVYNLHRPESLSIFHGITVRPLLMDHHYQGFRVVHEPNPPEYNQSSYQNNPSAMSASSSNHSTSFGHLDTDVENTTSPVIDPRFAQSQYARPRLEIAYQESSPHNQFEAPYNAIQHYAPSSERGYNPHVSSFPRFTDGHQSNIAQEQYSSYEDSHHIGSQPRYRPPLASDNTSPIAQRPSNLVDGEGAHPHSTWHTTLPHPHTSISHAAIPAISGHASYPHMGVHLPVPSYQNTYHDTNATSWSEQSDTVFHEGDHSPGINLDVNHDNTQPYAPTHPRADPSHPYWRSRQ